MGDKGTRHDGSISTATECADHIAIQRLVVAYGHAVDDRDWSRWRSLFTDDATLDYTESGGIAGSIDEVAAWLPGGTAVFRWSLHSVFTHEITFTGPDTATGRAHLFNRNGAEWNGKLELLDVSGVYLDEYRKVGDRWCFTRRREHCLAISGGEFAAAIRAHARTTAPDADPLGG